MQEHIAPAFQTDGGKAQVQAVDDGLQFSLLMLRDIDVGIHVDGKANAAEGAGTETGPGIGIQGKVTVLGAAPQLLQAQGYCVGRETSGNHEGIDGQLYPGLVQRGGFHLAVHGHAAHAEHAVQGIPGVGENDERPVCEADVLHHDGRQRFALLGSIFGADGKDVPVGSRGIIIVRKDARALKLHPVHTDGAAPEERHIVQ